MKPFGNFKKIAKKAGFVLIFFFAVYGAASFLNDYIIQYERIDGTSMEPLLVEDERVLISKIPFWFHGPERFDVIAFSWKHEFYVKRVIGLPGEAVSIKDGNIYIDGQVLPENYGKDKMAEDMEEVVLEENEYFVLGDNRNYSLDSRNEEMGTVDKKQVMGKVLFK